jgi:hypothetical protein
VGSFGSPLDLKSAGYLAYNGGLTPTLKLRDDSPARNAGPQLAAADTSQNGYTWAAGTRADIGAWGGAPNQAPVPNGAISFDVPEGGSITITADQILSQMTDANGDGMVSPAPQARLLRAIAVAKSRIRGNWRATGAGLDEDAGRGQRPPRRKSAGC